MYADVVNVTVDMARLPEAVAGIEGAKKSLKGMRGFRGAYFFQPIDGHGMSVSLWDDEEAAKAAASAVTAAPGVSIQSIETRAVIAQA